MVCPDKPYVSLEAMDFRDFARADPRGFLAEYADGAILDEIQHVPELLSYLQVDVDERLDPGRFILTGSQHLGLSQTVSQSLAGRCGILVLLPPHLSELRSFPDADSVRALRELGVRWALVDTASYPDFPRVHLRIESSGLQFVSALDGQYLYEIRAATP